MVNKMAIKSWFTKKIFGVLRKYHSRYNSLLSIITLFKKNDCFICTTWTVMLSAGSNLQPHTIVLPIAKRLKTVTNKNLNIVDVINTQQHH